MSKEQGTSSPHCQSCINGHPLRDSDGQCACPCHQEEKELTHEDLFSHRHKLCNCYKDKNLANSPQDNVEGWEEEFDKKFKWLIRKDSVQMKVIDCWDLEKELKSFISNLLSQERAKVVEEIQEAIKRVCGLNKSDGTPVTASHIEQMLFILLNNLKREEPKQNVQPSRDERYETTINFNPLDK